MTEDQTPSDFSLGDMGLDTSSQGRADLLEALTQLGARDDDQINPAIAALLLGALDRPGVSLQRYLHHLSLLTRDAADLAQSLEVEDDLEARHQVLQTILAERYGYLGDETSYDDPQNANFLRVIDRRQGLPVALALLYLHTARSLGWTIRGLAFPGHFLLRLDLGAERLILDPFNGGRRCDVADLRALLKALAGNSAELEPRYYQTVSDRQILLRLVNNLKIHHLKHQQADRALDMIERMLLLSPGSAELWREAGLLQAQQEELIDARRSFERFLKLSHSDQEKQEVAALLQKLSTQLN
ncbi:SirB1 family protein [Rhodovibrionaceae bacterium A322]